MNRDEPQSRVRGRPGFTGETEFVELGPCESADEHVGAGGAQGAHLVLEPVTAPGPGHGAQPPGAGQIDGEEARSHSCVTFVRTDGW